MPLESAALREGAGEDPGARRPASGRKPRFPRGWGGTNEESFEGRRGHSRHVCSRRRGTDHGGRSAHRFEAPSRGRRPGRSTRARATLTTRRCSRRARAQAASPARAGASLNRQRSASGTMRVRSIPLCAGTSPPSSTASVSSSAASATSALGVSTKRGSTGSTTRRRRSAATSTGYGEATRSSGTSPTSRAARTLARSLSFVRPPTCRRPSHSAYGPSPTTRVAGRRRPPACKSGAARQRSPMRSGGRAWRRRARAPSRLRAGSGNDIQAAWTTRCVNGNLARRPATRGERIVGTNAPPTRSPGPRAPTSSERAWGRTASSWTAVDGRRLVRGGQRLRASER